ncbi:polyhydroxyalkanoate synthesis repressor PhaR [Polymorphobacter glacialis]|uniref:Polyhydroxyalkanoate synthesis repressor PhaR n=1 Tax=Sandarakinorhabdus glacialis TaxID=1614636 RepID=A0A916ZHJ4_9SPHN|nr:polyhydroxyalkanoate synthesis repressor PhaR [Polymorphobacter glacialis]GGD98433.1 polyhydroxyalkanoate synthesis repressor PhaR [Polymorphobacter glacialis]
MAESPSSKAGSSDGHKPAIESGSVIIKKYANRRLYNTETSSYITLDHLATMTRDGRDFQVFDARSGEDITRSVLTQIVMEEESTGQTMLPVPFLRQIIAMYGDSMQSMVPHYLEASMAAFAENQNKFRDAALKPFEQLAKQNLALFQAAAGMLTSARPVMPPQPTAPTVPAPTSDSELSALKAQLAALQARLDGIAKG